jgi:hypothetical protein
MRWPFGYSLKARFARLWTTVVIWSVHRVSLRSPEGLFNPFSSFRSPPDMSARFARRRTRRPVQLAPLAGRPVPVQLAPLASGYVRLASLAGGPAGLFNRSARSACRPACSCSARSARLRRSLLSPEGLFNPFSSPPDMMARFARRRARRPV